MDLSGAVVWFISGIANKKSFTELTYVSPCITLSFLANFKCFFLFLNEDSVDKLLEKLRELEMNERARPKHKDKEAIMIHEYKFLTNLISFLNLFFCGLIVAFALGPVAITIFIYVTTNEVDLQLPFLIIYPFDAFTMKYWPWVYLHQIWSEVVVIVGLGAADYLFYTFCSNISVQFQLLKYNIEHLIPDDETCGRLPNIEEIRTELVDLIKWHQDLISSVKLLETIYTRSTLLNFVSSSALICLTGFNVLAGSDFVYVMTFVSFLFLSALQIFFLCFFGDLLLNSARAAVLYCVCTHNPGYNKIIDANSKALLNSPLHWVLTCVTASVLSSSAAVPTIPWLDGGIIAGTTVRGEEALARLAKCQMPNLNQKRVQMSTRSEFGRIWYY
ncbi:unnamed protein product [Spodoptera exigua]|nr:unnamed protein product [Spodoptera exigua]